MHKTNSRQGEEFRWSKTLEEFMSLKALSYLGIRSDKLNDWSSFAGGLLGMQKIDKGGRSMAFRMDSQEQRLLVSDEVGVTLAAKLDAAGTPVHIGTRELDDRRLIQDLIWFLDPMGNRNELVYMPMLANDPFVPGRPIDGFKTGPWGMGYAALHVQNIEIMMPFYRDVLGFKVSDYGTTP